MATIITAREANQQFSKLLSAVEAGAEFAITKNGVVVARIVPAAASGRRKLTPSQEAALERTRQRLQRGWPLGGEKLDRASLYD